MLGMAMRGYSGLRGSKSRGFCRSSSSATAQFGWDGVGGLQKLDRVNSLIGRKPRRLAQDPADRLSDPEILDPVDDPRMRTSDRQPFAVDAEEIPVIRREEATFRGLRLRDDGIVRLALPALLRG